MHEVAAGGFSSFLQQETHKPLIYRFYFLGFLKLRRALSSLKYFTFLRSYLVDETQGVHVVTPQICLFERTTGVPQGSILGPIIKHFQIQPKIHPYADDTIIYMQATSIIKAEGLHKVMGGNLVLHPNRLNPFNFSRDQFYSGHVGQTAMSS